LSLLGGVLYVAAGVLALMFPLPSVLFLALCLATLLIADGITRVALASRIRKHEGWMWVLVGGAASFALGVLLIVAGPGAGLWALGLLLGMNLMLSGATNAVLALTCRERHRMATRTHRARGATPAAA
jgi:uncharacterized membrane protein HdeD (DUF308 family)